MDKTLQALFEYQHFCKNKKLDAVISQTIGSEKELTMNDLGQVNAAGGTDCVNTKDGGAVFNAQNEKK